MKKLIGNPKCREAKELLVRYIRDNHLKHGARLPPQDTLRRLFHVGASTIAWAINDLRVERVLEVRDKVGVFVRDPNVDGHAAYTIGVLSRHYARNTYYSSLLNAAQYTLGKIGCQGRFFYAQQDEETLAQDHLPLDVFTGLRRNIEDGELQGILHLDDLDENALAFCRRHKVPTLFLGSRGGSNAPDGFFYDRGASLQSVHARLLAERPRRPALLTQPSIREEVEPVFRRAFGDAARIYIGHTVADGTRIGEEIAALPPKEQPYWFIFLDDVIALAVLSHLAVRLPAKRLPHAVIFTMLHHELCFPVPSPLLYTIDLDDIVSLALNELLRAMQEKRLEIGRFHKPFLFFQPR